VPPTPLALEDDTVLVWDRFSDVPPQPVAVGKAVLSTYAHSTSRLSCSWRRAWTTTRGCSI